MSTLNVTLTSGAITNGYIAFPLEQSIFPPAHYGDESGQQTGQSFDLQDELGNIYQTDIRVSGKTARLRARFTAHFKKTGARSGDTAQISQTGPMAYSLRIIKAAPSIDQNGTGNLAPSSQHPTGKQASMNATNTILYGPPGTGKTFSTARLAVELCDQIESTDLNQEAIRIRFEQLRHEGRIFFVTFHQSFGYEEFVEGLRPRTTPTGQVVYEVRPGIFRQACEAARSPTLQRPGLAGEPIAQRNFYKMSLGAIWNDEGTTVFDYCVKNDCVLLGWGDDIDFTDCGDRAAIEAHLAQQAPRIDRPASHARMVHRFKHEMSLGDLVLVSQGNHFVRGIAEITGSYEFVEDAPFQQMRRVRWLTVFPTARPVEDFYDRGLTMQALYRLDTAGLHLDALKQAIAPQPQSGESLPYVLIIDEINRANISKVFGELITLIEPDKREGMTNAARVTLPYSGTEFGVPSNLHLVGTMNTADRSIALLDTALRRRFDFEEVMPDPSCLKDNSLEGVDLEKMLTAINERIEVLFNRDHTIGHAYFMSVNSLQDLQRVFRRRVLPLLQEYFYENWSRIQMALNDRDGHFIQKVSRKLPAIGGLDDYSDESEGIAYRVNPTEFPIEAFRNIYQGN